MEAGANCRLEFGCDVQPVLAHPSQDSIIDAMERMTGHSEGTSRGGHKTGHSAEESQITAEGEKLLTF